MTVGTYRGELASMFDGGSVNRKDERILAFTKFDEETAEVQWEDGTFELVDIEDVELD